MSLGRSIFGVSEFTTMPWTFEEDIERYADLGLLNIEIVESKLDYKDPVKFKEQLSLVTDQMFTISSVQPATHSLFPDYPRPEPESPSERMALLRQTIERFAKAGYAMGTVFVTIPGAAPDQNYRLAYETATKEYTELAKFAAGYGAKIALEPLNPILMNIDTFICTISDAMRVVREVNNDSFGILLDTWHIWQDSQVEKRIDECMGKIFAVHVNDWHSPRCMGDRAVIGAGQIPFPKILRAIHETGYRGVYTLEIFSELELEDSLWKGDISTVITRIRQEFGRAWNDGLKQK